MFDIVIAYLDRRRVEKSIIVHVEVGDKCSLLGLILYTWRVTHPHRLPLCHWKDTEVTCSKYYLIYTIKQLTLLVTYVLRKFEILIMLIYDSTTCNTKISSFCLTLMIHIFFRYNPFLQTAWKLKRWGWGFIEESCV